MFNEVIIGAQDGILGDTEPRRGTFGWQAEFSVTCGTVNNQELFQQTPCQWAEVAIGG